MVKSLPQYFDSIASNKFYYGDNAGNSQLAKLVNNMILSITKMCYDLVNTVLLLTVSIGRTDFSISSR
jgi:hypothetical protein